MDSGSAPLAARHKKHFPVADLKQPKKYHQAAFTTATGQPFGADGEFVVNVETKKAHERQVKFTNADVTVPILSTGLMTEEDNDVEYRKWAAPSLTPSPGRFANSSRPMAFIG